MALTVEAAFQTNYSNAANAAAVGGKRAAALAAMQSYTGTGWKFVLQRAGVDVLRLVGSGQLPVVGTSLVITTANIASTELLSAAELSTGTWTGRIVNSAGTVLIAGTAGASGTDFIVSASLVAGATIVVNSVTFTLPASLDATVPTSDGPVGQTSSAWTRTFTEEFTSSSIDTSKWQKGLWYGSAYTDPVTNVEGLDSGGGAPNGYDPQGWVNYDWNAGGNSRLRIWPALNPNNKFYNTHFTTETKFTQKYGYFEIRAKLPRGKGCWPAFWLVNHDLGVPKQPEIDILEAYTGGGVASYWSTDDWRPTTWAPTFWTDAGSLLNRTIVGPELVNEVAQYGGQTLDVGFNTYGLKWSAGGVMTWYFNGVQRGNLTFNALDKLDNQPLFFVLTLAYGSASGAPSLTNDNTGTPRGSGNALEIDYVRIWQAA